MIRLTHIHPLNLQVIALACVLLASPAGAAQPTINLFPASVVENLKQSSQSAEQLEATMLPTIEKMKEQIALYDASHCDDGSTDSGCNAIRDTLGTTYKEMLDQMAEQLPAIKQSMSSIRRSMGKRLQQELGNRRTPRDLQALLSGKTKTARSVRQHTGKPRGRLSSLFGEYSSMIALHGSQNNSLPALASDMYLDAMETGDEIEKMELNINQSRAVLAISSLYYGEPSDAMVETVNAAKALLFGEVDDQALPNSPVLQQASDGFDDSELSYN